MFLIKENKCFYLEYRVLLYSLCRSPTHNLPGSRIIGICHHTKPYGFFVTTNTYSDNFECCVHNLKVKFSATIKMI